LSHGDAYNVNYACVSGEIEACGMVTMFGLLVESCGVQYEGVSKSIQTELIMK
jgi:hypothetical protein